MDFSLNLINIEKKIRFYCGDEIFLIPKIDPNTKCNLWYTEKDEKRSLKETYNEIYIVSQLKNITMNEAKIEYFKP